MKKTKKHPVVGTRKYPVALHVKVGDVIGTHSGYIMLVTVVKGPEARNVALARMTGYYGVIVGYNLTQMKKAWGKKADLKDRMPLGSPWDIHALCARKHYDVLPRKVKPEFYGKTEA